MTITLNLKPTLELTDEQFEQICRVNRDLKFERTAKGELVIVSPTGGETGKRNAKLSAQLWLWNHETQLGQAFDSSTGFNLPNGATRSPDAAWIKQERWDALTKAQRRKFLPLCPDFAVELRPLRYLQSSAPSDELTDTQAKMREYLENGLRLGWLIDPETQQVEIYRPNQPIEVLQNPTTLSGETVLPSFTLNLTGIMDDLD